MAEGDELKYVGQRTERTDTQEKATGRAVFGTDIYFPGLLTGKVLRSPRAHALIKKLDIGSAERLPGVNAVVTGADFPDSYWGSYLKDQTIYAGDRVRYIGQPIAAVAASDETTALNAVELIDVEYEDLPPVFDIEEGIKEDAPLIHPDLENYEIAAAFFKAVPHTNIPNHFRLRHGDIEKGFLESDEIFEDRYEIPMIQHCPMEPHASVAQVDSSGKVTIWSSTQGAYLTRGQVANALALPMNKVRIVGTFCGGAFGGKISACNEVISGSLAVHTDGAPVRFVHTREEEFVAGFVRQRVIGDYKTGVKKDGTFVARQVRLLWDTGAFGDYEISVARSAGYASSGPYDIPNVAIDSYAVYTNKPVAGAFRGFGVSEVCFCYEQQNDRIAAALGMDPNELREKNTVREGSITPTGQPLQAVGLKECIDKAKEALGWEPRENPPARPTIRRGRGLACMYKFTVHQVSVMANLKMNEDGSLLLQTAAVEHGQGAHTILRQIAAEELGCAPDDIIVQHTDTDYTPYGWQTSASKTTFFDGNAVALAARDVKKQLTDAAVHLFEVDRDEIVVADGKVYPKSAPDKAVGFGALAMGVIKPEGLYGGPILGRGTYTVSDGTTLDLDTGQGAKPSVFWMFAAQGAEVEVDIETGRVTVIRLTAAHDVGKAINPAGCEGQIEGALIQGQGTALSEEIVESNGQFENGNLGDYKMLTTLDIPDEMVPMVVEEPHPEGPWGAKGIGEPGLAPTAACIANAVYDAIGVQVQSIPLLPDKVLAALEGLHSDAFGRDVNQTHHGAARIV